jgi:hypothetical protein
MKLLGSQFDSASKPSRLSGFVPAALAIAVAAVIFPMSLNAQTDAQSEAAPPIAASASSVAAVPKLVRFSGVLLDGRGWPITVPVQVTFSIYAQPSGEDQPARWQETQQVSPNSKGGYTVLLGAATTGGVPVEIFKSGESQYLGVKTEGEPEQSRVLMVSVPYALKAGDAATLGGLPASAFALAGSQSASAATTITSSGKSAKSATPAPTPVTTTGGTSGYLSVFNGASSLADSVVYQSGASIGIGAVPNTGAALDVNGKQIVRGVFNLSRAGNATAAGGFNSYPFIFNTSAYSSTGGGDVTPVFSLQAEPTGNNTATPGATLNVLYNKNDGTGAETGLYFNSNGTIHFAPGQTFPAPLVTGTGTSQFQNATITSTTNTINATRVPAVDGQGGVHYWDVNLAFNTDSGGNLTLASGSPVITPSASTNSDGFVAGTYTNGSEMVTVSGPGVTSGGATQWTLLISTGSGCTTFSSATWYVGSLANNPLAARLSADGITSTAYSYGIEGGSCDEGYPWNPDALLGFSQTGNALTVVSFTNGIDHPTPVGQVAYLLKQ